MKFLRWPLFHFLVLGALALAVQRVWPVQETLVATSAAEADSEILLAEALKLGLDESDSVARERLLRNIQFAFPEREMPPEEALRLARRLDMSRQDAVVRRRLTLVMEQRIAGAVKVSDAQLRDYFDRHATRYGSPPRYRWQQLFFSGADARPRAEQALRRLAAGEAPEQVGADPFLGGTRFAASSAHDMQRVLGISSAENIVSAPLGVWQEPLVTAYGLHLLRVEEHIAAQEPDWKTLRPQLAFAILPELKHAAVQAELQRLRAQYRVEIQS